MKGFSRLFFILILFSILVLSPGCTLLWLINNDENVLFYTITFETNGASQIESQKVEEKTSATCPANPSKRGYIFAGWYLDTTFLSPFDFSSLIYHDTTLYAKWNAKNIVITLMNGEDELGSVTTPYGEALEALDDEYVLPAEDGASFIGYFTEENALGTQYYDGEGNTAIEELTQSENITLYAAFGYTITYNLNGGTNNSANPSFFTGATEVTLASATKVGNTFAGWYDNEGFTGEAITSIPKETAANVELYAKWVKNTYTVSFDSNGGTGTMDSMGFTYGTAQNLTANSFTRDGYNFAGWNTQADGNGTSYADGATVKNLSTTNGATVTLYAQWTPAP